MIKKYKLFFESFSISRNFNSPEEAYLNFHESLIDVIDLIESKNIEIANISYSYASQTGKNRGKGFDPEKDFEVINEYMERLGWSFENVRKLAASIPNFLDRAYDTGSKTACAAADYYLYKVTNGSYHLQGFEWYFDDNDSILLEEGTLMM